MQYTLILVCGFWALSGYWFSEKRIYNPITVFSLFWGILGYVSSFGLYHFYTPSKYAYTIIIAGVCAFSAGAMFMRIRLTGKKQRPAALHHHSASVEQMKIKLIYVLFFITILYLGIRAVRVAGMLLQGVSMDVIRVFYYDEGNELTKSTLDALYNRYVNQTIVTALIPVGLADYFSGSRHKGIFLLTIVTSGLSILCSGGRVIIFNLLACVFIGMLVYKYRVRVTYKQKKMIAIMVIVSICVIYITSVSRKTNFDLISEMYRYFAGAVVQMDVRIGSFDTSSGYTFGLTFLRGILLPLFMILNKFGIDYPELFYIASSIGSNLQVSAVVGNKVYMLAYATVFYYFYRDAGMLGVLMGSFLYGLLSGRLFRTVDREICVRNVAFYMLVIQGIVTSMVRWQFYMPSYSFAFLLIALCFKKKSGGKCGIET